MTPAKSVTNMLESLVSTMVWFMVVMMRVGLLSCIDSERNRLRVTAMSSDAGTPLPLTSPTQKNSFSLRM